MRLMNPASQLQRPRPQSLRSSASSPPGRHAGRRRSWAAALVAGLTIAVMALTGPVAAASAVSSGSFGPIPVGYPIESRCQGLAVASHVVFPGQDVIAHTSAGICGGPKQGTTWVWGHALTGAQGCRQDETYCQFKAGPPTIGYTTLCIIGGSAQGGWTSCDYYGVAGYGAGVIDGYVTDKDGGPVAGITVNAYGPHSVATTTAVNGWYAMQVLPGRYNVVPSGGAQGKTKPTYTPRSNDVTVAGGASYTADFQLDAGLELQLHLASSSVPADGFGVVKGSITTTMYGKPLGNVRVQLEAMPPETAVQAVTGGPRASVCGPNAARVWPTGSLSSPDGFPVIITTDASGHYNLSITVGTTPGTWSLDAWAENSNGVLSGDTTAASQTRSLALTPLGSGVGSLIGFVRHFNGSVAHTAALRLITANSDQIVSTLASVTAARAAGGLFDGLAYALVNAKDGQSVLIFRANHPPAINAQGEIAPGRPANTNDLVLDPAEWTGGGLVSKVFNVGSLEDVLDHGGLPDLPTLAEFDAGNPVKAWKTVPGNEVTLFSPNFEFAGWGYSGNPRPLACY